MEHYCKLLLLLIPLLHNHSLLSGSISLHTACSKTHSQVVTHLYAINFGPTEPQTKELFFRKSDYMLGTVQVLKALRQQKEIIWRYSDKDLI